MEIHSFENVEGKGENAGNQHFCLFQQCFQLFGAMNSAISTIFNLSSADALNFVVW